MKRIVFCLASISLLHTPLEAMIICNHSRYMKKIELGFSLQDKNPRSYILSPQQSISSARKICSIIDPATQTVCASIEDDTGRTVIFLTDYHYEVDRGRDTFCDSFCRLL